jgi:CDP-diacylglycerol--glycerol-3-phosphate 3-phosphatidyltransferase
MNKHVTNNLAPQEGHAGPGIHAQGTRAIDGSTADMFPQPMAITSFSRNPHKVWNLPNILTYGRLVAVPLVVACLFWSEEFWMRWTALALFTLAGITDFLDGYLARAWSQQSALGRMLDPIADKLLVAAVLLMLVADHTIASYSIWAAIVILCREMLVSGLREFLAELKVSIPVSKVAKWKTAMQLISLGFLIAGPSGDYVFPGTVKIGLVLLWLSALLTLYTGWDYLKAGVKHVVED